MKKISPQQDNRGGVLRLADVRTRTGLGRSTIYDLLRKDGPRYDPDFPKPFALSERARGWLCDDIDEWISGKASRRMTGGKR